MIRELIAMPSSKVLQADCNGVYVLKFVGEVRLNSCSTIDTAIENIASSPNFCSLVVDLTETLLIDSTTLGLLAKLAVKAKQSSPALPSIISTNPDITRILISMGFDTVFLIVEEPLEDEHDLVELLPTALDEDTMRRNVLNAHKVLMDLNENNREKFRDLVTALEADDSLAIHASL